MEVKKIEKPLTRKERFIQKKENVEFQSFRVNQEYVPFGDVNNKFKCELTSELIDSFFIHEIIGKKYFHFKKKIRNTSEILSWDLLNDILSINHLEFPRVFLIQDKQKVEPSLFIESKISGKGERISQIDVNAIQTYVKNGATLVVNRIEEFRKYLSSFCEDLQSAFLVPIHANLYLSAGNERGFGLHWDDHDVLIMQLEGRKKWELYGITRKYPLHKDTKEPDEPNRKLKELMLEQGDILYVPRGMWHNVTSIGTPSLHITVSINNLTGIDLLSWLIDDLRKDEVFRRDLPVFGSRENRLSYQKEFFQHLVEKLDDSKLDEFLNFQKINGISKSNFSFPHTITNKLNSNHSFQYIFRGINVIKNKIINNEIEYFALGKVWIFDDRLEGLIDRITEGDKIPHQELTKYANNSTEKPDEIIKRLLEEGFIEVASEC